MTKKLEQKIKRVVHDANTEYWQNERANEIAFSKGEEKPYECYSLPELISIRVIEFLDEELP